MVVLVGNFDFRVTPNPNKPFDLDWGLTISLQQKIDINNLNLFHLFILYIPWRVWLQRSAVKTAEYITIQDHSYMSNS